MKKYEGIFSSWKDVQRNYSMDHKEPDKVYQAFYFYEDYSGDSSVFYRHDGKYYEAGGSHCSCYGLEGQWDPTEFDKETFIEYLKRSIETDYSSFRIEAKKKVLRQVNGE